MKAPGRVAAAAFIASSFFPNPALPVGLATGLQLSQGAALAIAFVSILRGWPRESSRFVLALLVPIFVSGLWVAVFGHPEKSSLIWKGTLLTTMVLSGVVAGDYLAGKYPLSTFTNGFAVALALHVCVAAWQFIAFRRDEMPLMFLYQNPTFGQPTESYGFYVKRLCGLYPEPSVMGAALGPWLLLTLGCLIAPDLRTHVTPRWRWIQAILLVVGCGLVFRSGTGAAIPIVACMGIVMIHAALSRLKERNIFRALVGAMLIVVLFVSLAVGVNLGLEARFSGGPSDTWMARTASIRQGFTLLFRSAESLIVGVGPHQSSLLVQGSGDLLPARYAGDMDSIWSVSVRYLVETGAVGLVGLAIAMTRCVRNIMASRHQMLGLSVLLAWALSLTVSTSYMELTSMWVLAGVLLRWPDITGYKAPKQGRLRRPAPAFG